MKLPRTGHVISWCRRLKNFKHIAPDVFIWCDFITFKICMRCGIKLIIELNCGYFFLTQYIPCASLYKSLLLIEKCFISLLQQFLHFIVRFCVRHFFFYLVSFYLDSSQSNVNLNITLRED